MKTDFRVKPNIVWRTGQWRLQALHAEMMRQWNDFEDWRVSVACPVYE